jgi:hypothetical protein
MKSSAYLLKRKTAAHHKKYKELIKEDITWIKNFISIMGLSTPPAIEEYNKQN